MVRSRWKHVTADIDRYGTVRYYFRKRGLRTKTRLPGRPGSEEFRLAYEALLIGKPAPQVGGPISLAERAASASLRWLCQQYLASPEFKRLDIKTRTNRARLLATICNLPISPSTNAPIGSVPFAELTSKNIRRLRDRKSDTPEAANDWLKSLKAVFKWAVEAEHTEHNPAKEVAKIKTTTQGFHTWSDEEVEQYERMYAVGTRQQLALDLLLYTGQRKSDIVLFGPQHVKDGWLRFTQQKNRNSKPVTLEIPILPQLAATIAATPSGHLTFLVSKLGKAFSVGGFGMRFRDWCDAAGLPECTAHGLRKVGAVRAAQNGATTAQLMAIFGWRDIKQAELYTRAADQKRLAGDSMHLIRGGDKS